MTPYTGRRVLRVNDPVLLRGDAAFVGDLRLHGMLHAAVVRSSVAHGRVVSVDAAAALARDGIVGAWFLDDFAALRPLPCAWVLPGQRHDAYPVVERVVRWVGQPIGLIVGTSAAAVLDALDDVVVEYDTDACTVDVLDASVVLYADIPDNVAVDVRVGSPAAAIEALFAGAPHVVAQRFKVQRQTGAPMEPRGVLAAPDPVHGGLTVWTSTQTPHHVRDDLAHALRLPVERVRVVAPQVGGGFGPKDHLYADEAMVCHAARLLRTPVRWIEQRSEHNVATVHAREQVQDVRLAFDDAGRFLAIDATLRVDLGAQCSNVGAGPAFTTAALLEGPYRFEAAATRVFGVLTNKTPAGAYRGFGQAEAAWARERLVDEAARLIGMDPVDMRVRNAIGEMPHLTHSGQSYDSGDYAASMRRAAELVRPCRPAPDDGRRRGVGMASYVQFAGSATAVERNIGFRVPGYETVVLRMQSDGSVTLHTGLFPHGQGFETTFAQVAADGLGLPIEDVTVVSGDTSATPHSAGTIASRSMMMGGGATIGAAAELRGRLLAIAAHRLEAAVDDLEIVDRHVAVRGTPARAIAVAEIARDAWLGWDLPPGTSPGLEVRATLDPDDCVYSYATHAVAIAVDVDTGRIEVERYVVVQDCGTMVNPMIVEGQVHGGVAQGIGGALHEALVYDADGQPKATTLLDYGLPSAADVPSIVVEHLVHPSPRIPGGMKGMAEGGVIPTAAAIANALADAVPSIASLITEAPLDPQRVWQWLTLAGSGA